MTAWTPGGTVAPEGDYRVILLAPQDAAGTGGSAQPADEVITLRHGADGVTGEVRDIARGSIQGTVTAPALGDDGGDRPVRGALIRAETPIEVEAAAGDGTVLAADDFRATRTDRRGASSSWTCAQGATG